MTLKQIIVVLGTLFALAVFVVSAPFCGMPQINALVWSTLGLGIAAIILYLKVGDLKDKVKILEGARIVPLPERPERPALMPDAIGVRFMNALNWARQLGVDDLDFASAAACGVYMIGDNPEERRRYLVFLNWFILGKLDELEQLPDSPNVRKGIDRYNQIADAITHLVTR